MRTLFNFKWDKRTLCNILKFPFIITIRPFFFLFFIIVDFCHRNMDTWDDFIPAWRNLLMVTLYFWVIVSYNPMVHQTVYKWEYAGTYQSMQACQNAVRDLPGLDPASTRCIKTYSKE